MSHVQCDVYDRSRQARCNRYVSCPATESVGKNPRLPENTKRKNSVVCKRGHLERSVLPNISLLVLSFYSYPPYPVSSLVPVVHPHCALCARFLRYRLIIGNWYDASFFFLTFSSVICTIIPITNRRPLAAFDEGYSRTVRITALSSLQHHDAIPVLARHTSGTQQEALVVTRRHVTVVVAPRTLLFIKVYSGSLQLFYRLQQYE